MIIVRHVVLLVCLAGVGEALKPAAIWSAGGSLPLAVILAAACVLGPLAGLFGLWIGSHLLKLTGLWLGDRSPRKHLCTALAWRGVPFVSALVLWIPQLLLIGNEALTKETPQLDARIATQPLLRILTIAVAIIELVLAVWGSVLTCNTIAEVQGFRSAWRGLLNTIVASAGIVLVIMLLRGD